MERVRPQPLPVLWICGPPGVGKTAVAWRIFTDLASSRTVAYVDIDQLGICYPEPPDDPCRYRLKARNLGAFASSLAEAGATCLVVSGVADPVHGPHLDEIAEVDLTLARLRATPEVLRQRLTSRGGREPEQFEAVLHYADELDLSRFADVTIDTTALTVDELAHRVRQEAYGWPERPGPMEQRLPAASRVVGRQPASGGHVLWLIGATGAGKSTVGWELLQSALGSGVGAAFVDLDQIGFVLPDPDIPARHVRRASLLASMWAAYREVGASCLVVVGAVHDAAKLDEYTRALSTSGLTICRLHASGELLNRIRRRGQGAGPRLPGDALFGAPPGQLKTIAAKASEQAEHIEWEALGDVRVDTDGRSVEEVVAAVLAALPAWPRRS